MPSINDPTRQNERLLRQACVELDRRRRSGEDVKVESFFQQFPALAQDAEAAIELIYTELVLREELGETVRSEDYYRRFPQWADRLRKLMAVHDGLPQMSKHPTQAMHSGVQPPQPAPTAVERFNVPRSPAMLQLGYHLGDYEIVNVLGRGGSGIVYLGRSTKTHKMVAIKMILDGHWAGSDLISRFQAEAKVLSRLHHPNIVQIYTVSQWQGLPYFVMEYVGGGSLADQMTGQPLPFRSVARMIASLSRAIQLAHNQGVVHRDIKPGNILLVGGKGPLFSHPSPALQNPAREPALTAKLTDFGLAKFLDEAGTLELARRQPTRTGAIIGTPSYMAPEQALGRNKDVGPATDVYALGAVLYECLTGRPPFQGATYLDTLEQVRNNEPVSLRRLQPMIPSDLETICLKCLNKTPGKRYSRAADLAADLERFVEGQQIQARPVSHLDRLVNWCIKKPVHATMTGAIIVLSALIVFGTILAIVRLDQARNRADQAKQEALNRLFDSYVSQARVFQLSQQAGRRFRALELLREAVQIKPDAHLRDEIIACLALTDARVQKSWSLPNEHPEWSHIHPQMEWYAHANDQGGFDICSIADHSVVRRLASERYYHYVYLAFSADGKYFYGLAQDRENLLGRCLAWDVLSGRKVVDVAVSTRVAQVGYMPERARLVCPMADQSLAFIDLGSGNSSTTLKNIGLIERVAAQPTGKLLAVVHGPDRWVGLRDLGTGRLLYRFPATDGITTVSWSPNGQWLVLGQQDKSALVWEVPQGPNLTPRFLARLVGHERVVRQAIFSANGKWLLTVTENGTTHFWDVSTWQKELVIRGNALQFASTDNLVAYRDGSTMGIWEMGKDPLTQSFKMNLANAPQSFTDGSMRQADLCFTPDGSMLAMAGPRGVKILDAVLKQEVAQLLHESAGTAQFHPNGTSLLTFSKKGVQLWPIRVQTNPLATTIGAPQLLHEPMIDAEPFRAVWRPDGKEIALLDPLRGQVEVFAPEQPKARVVLPTQTQGRSLCWHPQQPWLVSGHARGKGVMLLDRSNQKVLTRIGQDDLHLKDMSALFSPRQGHLFVGLPNSFDCYEQRDGKWLPVRSLFRPELANEPGAMAMSASGRMAAFSLQPRKILVYDLKANTNIVTLTLPEFQDILALVFSQDEQRLVAMTESQNVYLWELAQIRTYLDEFGLGWESMGDAPAANAGVHATRAIRIDITAPSMPSNQP